MPQLRFLVCLIAVSFLSAGCQQDSLDEYRPVQESSITDSQAAPSSENVETKPADPSPASAASSAAEQELKSPPTLDPVKADTAAMNGKSGVSATPQETASPSTSPSAPAAEKSSAEKEDKQGTSLDRQAGPKGMAEASGTKSPAEAGTPASVSMPAIGPDGNPLPRPDGPLPIKLLVPHKDFTAEGPEKALRVTFDDIDLLKILNMEPVPEDAADHFPDWLKQLHGKKIMLRGWMYPPTRQEGISRFMFVRDNGICCFGRAPKVYDKVAVTLREGVTTRYIQNRPFDVVGTLLIEPEIDVTDEQQSWLYVIQDGVVIDN